MANRSIVIIGGGVMGMCVADALHCELPAASVDVVERDRDRGRSSTLRSDGNVRVQFNHELNIRCSLASRAAFDELLDGVTRPARRGNLFLVDDAGRAAAEEGLARQHHLGADVAWLDVEEIRHRFPFLSPRGDVVGGTWGPDDGAVDPGLVIGALRGRCQDQGVRETATEVTALEPAAEAWDVVTREGRIRADTVVVTAGAWVPGLLRPLGITMPVEPVARTVYVVRIAPPPPPTTPGVFLPDGTYALPDESGAFLVARSLPDDPRTTELPTRGVPHFEDVIWPGLATVVPAFTSLKVQGSWAGLYAQNTWDGNALVGEWPELPGLWVATGFSGHGFQHGPAVGRFLAESIAGVTPTLDLAAFSPARLAAGIPLVEHAGRLI